MKYVVDAKYVPSEELKEYMQITGNNVPEYVVILGVVNHDANDDFHLLLRIPNFRGHNASSYSDTRPDITRICKHNDCYFAPKDWVAKRFSTLKNVSIYNEVK